MGTNLQRADLSDVTW
ncbi:hypothetical protein NON20_09195 [Synechocystis sp. B12]|nr:hypothetical protein NON20_09195 [Synechocystis sp. B12]